MLILKSKPLRALKGHQEYLARWPLSLGIEYLRVVSITLDLQHKQVAVMVKVCCAKKQSFGATCHEIDGLNVR